jgi:hypothetical protein
VPPGKTSAGKGRGIRTSGALRMRDPCSTARNPMRSVALASALPTGWQQFARHRVTPAKLTVS